MQTSSSLVHRSTRTEANRELSGAADAKSLELATSFLKNLPGEVIATSSLEAAEACVFLENALLKIHMAAMHELKVLFDALGVDFREMLSLLRHRKPMPIDEYDPAFNTTKSAHSSYLNWIAHRRRVSAKIRSCRRGQFSQGRLPSRPRVQCIK